MLMVGGSTMLFTCRDGDTNVAILVNAPQPPLSISSEKQHHPPKPKGRRRPYFFKLLQERIGTHILADTLDWDALSHFNFDASSLDNVFKGLNHDVETYYHLWVAVHKVLADTSILTSHTLNNSHEVPIAEFSGARIGEDQKLKFLNELLDAALEQFVSFPVQCARERLSATKQ
ncbi:hypothetical protein BGW80DRAFT_1294139, partial [Lactifluus volemus]